MAFLICASAPSFFISSYSNIILPIIYLFLIYFMAIIKLSYALFLAVVEKLQYNKALVSDVFFCADPVLGILKVFTTDSEGQFANRNN